MKQFEQNDINVNLEILHRKANSMLFLKYPIDLFMMGYKHYFGTWEGG